MKTAQPVNISQAVGEQFNNTNPATMLYQTNNQSLWPSFLHACMSYLHSFIPKHLLFSIYFSKLIHHVASVCPIPSPPPNLFVPFLFSLFQVSFIVCLVFSSFLYPLPHTSPHVLSFCILPLYSQGLLFKQDYISSPHRWCLLYHQMTWSESISMVWYSLSPSPQHLCILHTLMHFSLKQSGICCLGRGLLLLFLLHEVRQAPHLPPHISGGNLSALAIMRGCCPLNILSSWQLTSLGPFINSHSPSFLLPSPLPPL